MYLIRDIDMVEIPEETVARLFHYNYEDTVVGLDANKCPKDMVGVEEIVSARLFRQCRSPDKVIKTSLGVSEKARKLLGLEESYYKTMEDLVWELRKSASFREKSIQDFDNTNRFKKAWWVLIGKKLTRGDE